MCAIARADAAIRATRARSAAPAESKCHVLPFRACGSDHIRPLNPGTGERGEASPSTAWAQRGVAAAMRAAWEISRRVQVNA